jgi:two-component system, chemotaxis family, protein-glutamate methylesterase/glutaminase
VIRVLIVDDSALFRKVLNQALSAYGDIAVVGSAVDPFAARDKIVRLKPDVLTLDVEMPRMDGLSFLSRLMEFYPLPVVVVSSLTPANGENAIRALELGAVEVICKQDCLSNPEEIIPPLVRAIRAASRADVRKRMTDPPGPVEALPIADGRFMTAHKVIAFGASTGGTQALEFILTRFPADFPGIVVTQHMPASFTRSFAKRLDTVCAIHVKEAVDEDRIVPGQALIAPGGFHMVLERIGAFYQVRIKEGPAVHHQKPSVDVLFHSVARHAGPNGAGILLTGMGADGAAGMLDMRENGVFTIAQDEATSLVFGMPAEAIRLGAAECIAGLPDIPGEIAHWLGKTASHAPMHENSSWVHTTEERA